MDLFAGLFSLTLLVLSAAITYHWGIKPDREEKKRRSDQAVANSRRQHWEKLRQRRNLPAEPID